VIYTKHLNQKSKVWEDGFLEYHIKARKVILFASSARCQQLEQKFYKTIPDLTPGELFRWSKYLVEIVTRRTEGKSSVKRENRSTSSKSKADQSP
jgi:hypothetical protein